MLKTINFSRVTIAKKGILLSFSIITRDFTVLNKIIKKIILIPIPRASPIVTSSCQLEIEIKRIRAAIIKDVLITLRGKFSSILKMFIFSQGSFLFFVINYFFYNLHIFHKSTNYSKNNKKDKKYRGTVKIAIQKISGKIPKKDGASHQETKAANISKISS